MAEQPVQPPDAPRPVRAVQRCPNCEARADVSFFVAGALVRCSRCAVRFEVRRAAQQERRRTPPPPPLAAPDLGEEKTVPSDRFALERAAAVDAAWQAPVPSPAPVRIDAAAQARLAAERAALRQLPALPEQATLARPPAQDKPAAPGVPTAAQRPGAPAAPLPQLEGFAVHERLGQGGMGEVYRCTQLQGGRPVAVKVLSASLAVVPDYVKRFEREAAAMAQLDHPGVVRLLTRGRTGPHCWIAMELIDGLSLRSYAHQSRPSSRALARLLVQVAHALAYAHARGVVHRDLKPDNVLVQADGKTKVLDFGLAGLQIQGAEILTQSNVAMGTANYMAPEQRKDAKHVDHRADLYSFGVMAYELLTGELPIGRFPPPSRVVPGLDKSWDALVERCLEVDPARRPHSALELAHALETLCGVAAPMELAPRTRRRAGRSRIWSWIGLGVGVAVILGIAGLRVAQDHGHRELRATVAAASLADGSSAAPISGRAVPTPRRGLHR